MSKIITVDFDLTLAEPVGFSGWVDDYYLKPVARVINFVMKKHKEGCVCHVVSYRYEKDREEMEDFITRWKIPIKQIFCTGSTSKVPVVKKLNSSLHIDDDIATCVVLAQAGIDVLLVDWEFNRRNSTSKLFDKI